MSDSDLIEMMVAARRSVSRAQAVELAAVAELSRRREAEDEVSGVGVVSARDYLHDEVASALTLTATSADHLIRFAVELTGRLPATFAALAAGELDYARACVIWQGTAEADDDIAAEIEGRVLSRAAEQTTGQIRAKIRRLVKRLDPDALARRREDAERRRDVQLLPTDDGTAHLSGLDLPADAATAAHNRVNAIAAGLKTDGDQRGIGQLRADVFLALLSGTMTTTEPPADPTHQQTTDAAALTSEDGWTGLDDAVADAIAHTARLHLTALSDERRGSAMRCRGLGELIVRTLTQQENGSTGSDRALADVTTHTAHAHLTALSGELHGSAMRNPGPGELLAHTVGNPPTASPGQRTDRGVPERHEGLAELIAQAGARITDALTALKTPWCEHGQQPNTAGTASQRGQQPSTAGTASQHGQQPSTAGTASRQSQQSRHGHGGYRVPARMRRLIENRDRRCGFPGCRRPVRHCDADHTIPYHRGGPTCPCNLAILCRHHHLVKQTRRWRLYQLWPGVLLWITPTGHWRVTAPPDRE